MPVSITRTDNASEAAQIIAQDSNAYILGGGTGLMRRIHEGDQNVRHLVRLQSQELIKIVKLGTTIRIGSQVLSLIHISEPTRLRCISYAVFCLKKKK